MKKTSLIAIAYLLVFVLGLGAVNPLQAQDRDAAASEEPTENPINLGISLDAGTSAIGGLSVMASFKRKIGIRVGYQNFSLSQENIEFAYKGVNLEHDINVERSHILALAEVSLVGEGAVRLVGGAGIFFDSNVNVTSISLDDPSLGEMFLDIYTENSINPYFGLGFGRPIPKKRVGLAFDVGVFSLGNMGVDMSATNLLVEENVDEDDIAVDVNDTVSLWPALTLRLKVRLI